MTWLVSLLDGRKVQVEAPTDAEACRVAAKAYDCPALIAYRVFPR